MIFLCFVLDFIFPKRTQIDRQEGGKKDFDHFQDEFSFCLLYHEFSELKKEKKKYVLAIRVSELRNT